VKHSLNRGIRPSHSNSTKLRFLFSIRETYEVISITLHIPRIYWSSNLCTDQIGVLRTEKSMCSRSGWLAYGWAPIVAKEVHRQTANSRILRRIAFCLPLKLHENHVRDASYVKYAENYVDACVTPLTLHTACFLSSKSARMYCPMLCLVLSSVDSRKVSEEDQSLKFPTILIYSPSSRR